VLARLLRPLERTPAFLFWVLARWRKIPFWLAIAFGTISLVLHASTDFLSPTPSSRIATLFWLLSVVSLLLYARLRRDDDPEAARAVPTPLSPTERAIVVSSCVAGLILRVIRIRAQGLYLDEWYWIVEAQRILRGDLFTPFGFIGDQPSNLQAFVLAPVLFLFRDPLLSVRIPGILYSLAALYFIFRTLREFVSNEAAVAACVLVSFSAWDVHQMELGYQNILVMPFLISAALYFLLKSIQTRKALPLVLCGLFTGIAFNTLYVAAVIVAVVATLWLRELRWLPLRQWLAAVGLLVVAFLVTCAPTFPKVVRFPGPALGQTQKFAGHNLSQRSAGFYLNQTVLLVKDYRTTQHSLQEWQPWGVMLDPSALVAFVAGLLYCLIRVRRQTCFALLIGLLYFSMVMVFLYRFTSLWREYALFVFIYSIAGVGIAPALTTAKRWSLERAAAWGVLAISAASFLTLYSYYVEFQAQRAPYTYEAVCGRAARELLPYVRDGYRILLREGTQAVVLIPIQLPPGSSIGTYKDLAEVEELAGNRTQIFVDLFGTPNRSSLEGLKEALQSPRHRYREVQVTDSLGTRAALYVSP
jgi:4-amino-4-deoxy-L-arabinose transferase-like glycosyltransferase